MPRPESGLDWLTRLLQSNAKAASGREIGILLPKNQRLAHPEGCAALRIVLVTVPRVSRSCERFPDGFDLHLLPERDAVPCSMAGGITYNYK